MTTRTFGRAAVITSVKVSATACFSCSWPVTLAGVTKAMPEASRSPLRNESALLIEPRVFDRREAAAGERQCDERDEQSCHMLSARLSTASAASFIASDSDGCAWQIMPMSSAAAPNSIAATASAISSPA